MKILLINPAHDNNGYQRLLGSYTPPLNLLYLASYLIRGGHEVKVLDLYVSPLPWKKIREYIGAFAPGLIGVATYSLHMHNVRSLCGSVKSAFPGIKIVLGGIHASYLSDVCLADKNVDFIVRGEGEETLLELVEALEGKRQLQGIKGLSYRNEGEIVSTENRPLIKDLDSLPLPAYQLIDFEKYYFAPTRAVTHRRVASVLTSRGCGHLCTFCSHHYGYDYSCRYRSPQCVASEIRHLCLERRIEELRIEDCSFTSNPARAVEICSLIKGLRLKWNCDIRADTASEELFSALSGAGCKRVFLGVESGSDELLKRMKKGITIEQARNAVSLAKKFNMRINCAFIIGTPGETASSAEKSFRLAKELDPDYVMFSVLMPSAGSELFGEAFKRSGGREASLPGPDFVSMYTKEKPVVEMSGLDSRQLRMLMKKFSRGYYLRPVYIFRSIMALRSFKEFRGALRGLFFILGIPSFSLSRKDRMHRSAGGAI